MLSVTATLPPKPTKGVNDFLLGVTAVCVHAHRWVALGCVAVTVFGCQYFKQLPSFYLPPPTAKGMLVGYVHSLSSFLYHTQHLPTRNLMAKSCIFLYTDKKRAPATCVKTEVAACLFHSHLQLSPKAPFAFLRASVLTVVALQSSKAIAFSCSQLRFATHIPCLHVRDTLRLVVCKSFTLFRQVAPQALPWAAHFLF